MGKLIKERRKAVGLRYSDLQRKSGLTYAYLKSLEAGKRIPKIETLLRLSEALKTPLHELLSALGVPVIGAINLVPVISWVNAGNWMESYQSTEVTDWVVTDVAKKEVFALRIEGDSMSPEFAHGDLVVVDPYAGWVNGSYVIALKDNETIFKQFKVYGKTAVLKPLNPSYDDIVLTEEIQIIGRVIRKIKRY